MRPERLVGAAATVSTFLSAEGTSTFAKVLLTVETVLSFRIFFWSLRTKRFCCTAVSFFSIFVTGFAIDDVDVKDLNTFLVSITDLPAA